MASSIRSNKIQPLAHIAACRPLQVGVSLHSGPETDPRAWLRTLSAASARISIRFSVLRLNCSSSATCDALSLALFSTFRQMQCLFHADLENLDKKMSLVCRLKSLVSNCAFLYLYRSKRFGVHRKGSSLRKPSSPPAIFNVVE